LPYTSMIMIWKSSKPIDWKMVLVLNIFWFYIVMKKPIPKIFNMNIGITQKTHMPLSVL
jgi:hypothetical protein